jgi:CsoR family transcriptional regulator, copper-sensing transcriptional repressor
VNDVSSHKIPDVISRLSSIEGHIRGIKKMAEEGRSLEELLLQVSAVKSAINAVGRVILEDYLEDCVVDGIRQPSDSEVLDRMKKALEKFI